MKTLVLGLGNPILSDDGVGIKVSQEVARKATGVDVMEASLGGLALLDIITGYDRVIMVDAILTGTRKPGEIVRFGPEDIADSIHSSSPHDVNFSTALELGKALDIPLPKHIILYGIEAADITNFSEQCTPEVQEAVARCTDMVLEELRKNQYA